MRGYSGAFMIIKSNNRACFSIVGSIAELSIINHNIHSMLTMHTIILQPAVYTLGMFMEERKIAL